MKQQLTVETTSDLNIFKSISGNRPPNPQHIKRLADSIKRYGMLINPILVNENFEVIDGQHRLAAAIEAKSCVHYIVIKGYKLEQVHALNLNQKNWTASDFLDGYASMGVHDYIILKQFWERHPYFTLRDCIAMCSNLSSSSSFNKDVRRITGSSEVFKEGTWKARNLKTAEQDAKNIKLLEPYYDGYNKSSFVGTMLLMFRNKNFDFGEFMQKIRNQPTALVDCANREQYKSLIEDIYNFRRREKVNLRY